MARITGLGGIFFKCADPKALAAWYRDKLGVAVEDWGGAVFESANSGDAIPDTKFTFWDWC